MRELRGIDILVNPVFGCGPWFGARLHSRLRRRKNSFDWHSMGEVLVKEAWRLSV